MKKEKLLLLSCCAPCSIGVISSLKSKGADFSVLFYNPNIQPESEYIRRRDENKYICQKYNIPFIELKYEPEIWEQATKGLENEPEKGRRCDICFYLRLRKACEYAKKNSFTQVSSVLGISRWKDFNQVCRAGKKAEAETGVPYNTTNWRKNGGLEQSEHLSKEMNLYRQNYCGCKPKK